MSDIKGTVIGGRVTYPRGPGHLTAVLAVAATEPRWAKAARILGGTMYFDFGPETAGRECAAIDAKLREPRRDVDLETVLAELDEAAEKA